MPSASSLGDQNTNGAIDDTSDIDAAGIVTDSVFSEDANPVVAELPFIDRELIVHTLPGAENEELQVAYDEAGVTLLETSPQLGFTVVQVDPGELIAAAAHLGGHSLIGGVQKNYVFSAEATPNDPQYVSQTYLSLVDLPGAWDLTTGDADMLVAVLDTGVDAAHPDLAGRLRNGWNAFDRNTVTADATGHGTGVAGVIGALSNNFTGLAGVSWTNPLMPVRVTAGDGRASSRSIADGITFATDHGAKVINLSFAPVSADRTVLAAAEYARNSGILVFISAGNDGKALQDADSPSAIFIGAVDSSERAASFTNTGPFVDFAAPGVSIVTPTPGGSYKAASGTSFASPIVAGIAALVWSVRPELRPTTVETLLRSTSADLGGAGRDNIFGAGLVQAGAAVAAALEAVEEADTTPPTMSMTKPREGDRVTRTLDVRVTASDVNGVADVVLSLDGVPYATDTTSPYKFGVTTSRLTSGTHTVTCVASDTLGNTTSPVSVRVTIGDGSSTAPAADAIKPGVVINFPVEGTRVQTSVGIQATATDNAGLSKIHWLVDGAQRQQAALTGTRAVASFVWNAGSASSGNHTITARVTDAAGNQATATVMLVKQ